MDREQRLLAVDQGIAGRREDIIAIGETIYRHPESGYREFATARYIADQLGQMGLEPHMAQDIPAVKATLDTGKPGPGLAILGEMDALVIPEHPDSDPETGAVHACGHNAQIAQMLGAAMALVQTDALTDCCGKIHFIAVPAEELIEIAYRTELMEKGIIRYLGGKQELLYRGFFDDADICAMIHLGGDKKTFNVSGTSNGLITKKIRYIGQAAHAGGSPHEGINALYAANLAVMAINALRETFQEKDYVRVHMIMTHGGTSVNVIPADVRLEMQVRAKTMKALLAVNQRVDQALKGAAVAMGARLEIKDMPGYYPLRQDKNLLKLAAGQMKELVGSREVVQTEKHGCGSTDMGDLSAVFPVIHPHVSGASGHGHGVDYAIADPEKAYILGARLLARLAVILLEDEAAEAKRIITNFRPAFKGKEAYLEFMDSLFQEKNEP